MVKVGAAASATGSGDRETFLDVLRAAAIAAVVLGHWLVTGIRYKSGHFSGVDYLGAAHWVSWLTLFFQVVPVFFFVGGYLNALSWTKYQGDDSWRVWPGWVRRRIMRLLVPSSGYVVVIAIGVAICGAVGVDRNNLYEAAWALGLHLWFLAAYGVVLLFTPALYAAHRRFGLWSFVALAGLAVVIDVGYIEGHWPVVGWANYVLVWGAFHQLGFAWHDGTFVRRRRVFLLGGVALVALVALIWPGPYPVSMVGVPGARIENASPPSAALLAFGVAQAAAILLVEPYAAKWLAGRPRFRARARNAAGWSMPVYLWHMVPVVVVATVGYPLHLFAQPRFGGGSWWAERLWWVGLLAVVLVVVLAVVRVGALALRHNRTPEAPSRTWSLPAEGVLVVGIASAAVGLGRLAVDGFAFTGRLDGYSVGAFAVGLGLVAVSKPQGSAVERLAR